VAIFEHVQGSWGKNRFRLFSLQGHNREGGESRLTDTPPPIGADSYLSQIFPFSGYCAGKESPSFLAAAVMPGMKGDSLESHPGSGGACRGVAMQMKGKAGRSGRL